MLNPYGKPNRSAGLVDWVIKTAHDHKHNHLVVAVDFHSQNSAWGYTDSSPRGRKIEEVTTQAKLVAIEDILELTCIENSFERNSMSDLAWTIQSKYARWYNTQENLSSCHHIVTN
ncbi:hypothetical protein HPB48_014062 [Haemaphysalis longicornis]|uniref:Endonuclease/exonuclease/phosphatase domain-containing protein n=1 Tax=Haemaphysalis longicornis TaxID=44386 RepID=A0A9J6FQH4_HAELO|nr:hypothetical protein HPB48_014062 [Haemaphysalis longicornis]